MQVIFYKYQGAGNDFIIIDNRNLDFPKISSVIHKLCDRHFGIGADGLMLLESHNKFDFKMVYYNSDGNESTMCGNGGRCIVTFANRLGIIENETTFTAIDGEHYASVINNVVKLEMIPVAKSSIELNEDDTILNTGSPHFIIWKNNIDSLNIVEEAQKIRYNKRFKQQGINVNFVEKITENHLKIRTYERGVENETLACGTGVTAAALAYALKYNLDHGKIQVDAVGDTLWVEWKTENTTFENVILEGKATFVFSGIIDL